MRIGRLAAAVVVTVLAVTAPAVATHPLPVYVDLGPQAQPVGPGSADDVGLAGCAGGYGSSTVTVGGFVREGANDRAAIRGRLQTGTFGNNGTAVFDLAEGNGRDAVVDLLCQADQIQALVETDVDAGPDESLRGAIATFYPDGSMTVGHREELADMRPRAFTRLPGGQIVVVGGDGNDAVVRVLEGATRVFDEGGIETAVAVVPRFGGGFVVALSSGSRVILRALKENGEDGNWGSADGRTELPGALGDPALAAAYRVSTLLAATSGDVTRTFQVGQFGAIEHERTIDLLPGADGPPSVTDLYGRAVVGAQAGGRWGIAALDRASWQLVNGPKVVETGTSEGRLRVMPATPFADGPAGVALAGTMSGPGGKDFGTAFASFADRCGFGVYPEARSAEPYDPLPATIAADGTATIKATLGGTSVHCADPRLHAPPGFSIATETEPDTWSPEGETAPVPRGGSSFFGQTFRIRLRWTGGHRPGPAEVMLRWSDAELTDPALETGSRLPLLWRPACSLDVRVQRNPRAVAQRRARAAFRVQVRNTGDASCVAVQVELPSGWTRAAAARVAFGGIERGRAVTRNLELTGPARLTRRPALAFTAVAGPARDSATVSPSVARPAVLRIRSASTRSISGTASPAKIVFGGLQPVLLRPSRVEVQIGGTGRWLRARGTRRWEVRPPGTPAPGTYRIRVRVSTRSGLVSTYTRTLRVS